MTKTAPPSRERTKPAVAEKPKKDQQAEGEKIESKDEFHLATAEMADTISGSNAGDGGDGAGQKMSSEPSGRDNQVVFLNDDVVGLNEMESSQVVGLEGETIVGLEEEEKTEAESEEAEGAELTESEMEMKRAESKAESRSLMNKETAEGTQNSPVTAERREGQPAVLTTDEKPATPEAVPVAKEPTPAPPPVSPIGESLTEISEMEKEEEQEEDKELEPEVEEVAEGEDGEEVEEEGADTETEEAPDDARPPTLSEAQAELDSGRTPADDLAIIEGHKANMAAVAEAEKTSIAAAVTEKTAAIQALATAEIDKIKSMLVARKSEVIDHHAALRKSLGGTVAARKATLASRLAADIALVEKLTTVKKEFFASQIQQRRDTFSDFIKNAIAEPDKIVIAQSDRFDREIDNSVTEATSIGTRAKNSWTPVEGKESKQKAAVTRAGESAGEDMTEKKGGMRAELQAKTEGYTDNYNQYLTMVLGQLNDVETDVTPEIGNIGTATIEALKASHTATVKQIDDNYTKDLARLNKNQTEALSTLDAAADQSISQVEAIAAKKTANVEKIGEDAIAVIDESHKATIGLIDSQEEVYLHGVTERIETVTASFISTKTEALGGMQQVLDGTTPEMVDVSTQFDAAAAGGVENAKAAGDAIVNGAIQSLDGLLENSQMAAEAMVAETPVTQDLLISKVFEELDPSIKKAREEVEAINTQFLEDAKLSVDDSLVEARKPITDDLWTRMGEAWDKAGEPWWKGALRALGSLLVGLLVVIILAALLIIAVAVIFGTVLTMWTAMMIVGLVFLAVAFTFALIKRSGDGSKMPVFAALSDAIGLSDLWAGVSDHDIPWGTGVKLNLSDAERAEKGITGGFTLVMTFMMGKGAIKGPPGGAYTRPVAWPRGFGGWRGGFVRRIFALDGAFGEVGGTFKAIGSGIANFVRNPIKSMGGARRAIGEGLREQGKSFIEFWKNPRNNFRQGYKAWSEGSSPIAIMLRGIKNTGKALRDGFNSKFGGRIKSMREQVGNLKKQIGEFLKDPLGKGRKAAAEKAAAEQKAAEQKAAEQKAAAEKKAAEKKAAEEKAAAEKKAAEEKAEAERKAAEEKAAEEKAEAERKAAEEKAKQEAQEKADAERKAAEEKAAQEKAEREAQERAEKEAKEKEQLEREQKEREQKEREEQEGRDEETVDPEKEGDGEPIPEEEIPWGENERYPDYKPCFLAGTQVLLEGQQINIEEIVIGDRVMADAGKQRLAEEFEVTDTYEGRTQDVIELIGGGGNVFATLHHRFMTVKRGWVKAKDLTVGEELITNNGSVMLENLKHHEYESEVATYNLTVHASHTYFVEMGSSWLLTHNNDGFGETLYWLLSNKPGLRPTDTDGLSLWRTDSKADVETLFKSRVHDSGRGVKDQHSFYTKEQLAGAEVVKTPSTDILAKRGLEHYSLRPEGVDVTPDYQMSEAEMTKLQETIDGLENPTRKKPNQVKC